MFVDYYLILCVDPSSSDQEIKKAYRIQAMKWHPDKNPGKDTNERMALINEAYCILRDPEARSRYDMERARYYDQLHKSRDFNNKNTQSHSEYKYSSYESNNTSFYRKDSESNDFETEFSSNYVYSDEVLSEWISRARCKAKELVKQSLDDLIGMTSAATTGFARGIRDAVIVVILGTLVSLVLMLV